MALNEALGQAIKQVRTHKGYTQENFSTVSSRTYMSTLERGMKSPTVEKLDQISAEMDVHPLTILMLTYAQKDYKGDIQRLLRDIQEEIKFFA